MLLSSREPGKEEEEECCCCCSRVVDRTGSWQVELHSRLLQTVPDLRRGRPGSCGSKSSEQVRVRQVVVMARGARWTGTRAGGLLSSALDSESTSRREHSVSRDFRELCEAGLRPYWPSSAANRTGELHFVHAPPHQLNRIRHTHRIPGSIRELLLHSIVREHMHNAPLGTSQSGLMQMVFQVK
jgi:hypothetical protein